MLKILLVDDDNNILEAYKRHLYKKYEVVTAANGVEGLAILKEQGPFAVVVSDFRMPEMNGIQFLSAARKLAPDTVRVMLTGQADMQAAIDAINEGNLFRFLTKPCSLVNFINALKAAVEQYELIISEREILEKTLRGSIKILMEILSLVSPAAFSLSSRIRGMARRLALRLNAENAWEIELAAMLSQIGCVTIPGEILEKRHRGDDLSEEELYIFESHPQAGKKLLINIPRLEGIAQAIAYQEKRYDGGGGPEDKVKGKGIPLASRILKAVLDYEMLRITGRTPVQSVEIMRSREDSYDLDVLAALDAEINSIKEGYIVRAMGVNEIYPGLVLADDIKDKKGVVLIPRDYEITDILKTRLLNYARYGNVVEPIKILERVEQQSGKAT